MQVSSTPTSIELSWPSAPDADAYWVSLNQRNLGLIRKDDNGKVNFTMSGLIPAMTYPFEITATSLDGGVSDPVKVQAQTVNAFPDLVVRSLKTVPENPKEGDKISFIAVIENCGNIATEPGTIVGTKFGVDGKTICWCDTVRRPVNPGEKVEVRPNSGPNGATSLKLGKGAHHVTALVDDVNRIVESNEGNNIMTIKVGTGSGPDLIAKSVKVNNTQKEKPLVIHVLVENQGSESIPKGASVSAKIANMGAKPPKTIGFGIDKNGIPANQTVTIPVKIPAEMVPQEKMIKIKVIVDDVDRIPETDDSNNSTDLEIEINNF